MQKRVSSKKQHHLVKACRDASSPEEQAESRENLIIANQKLVSIVAERYMEYLPLTVYDLEDLVQIGNIGLIKAVDSFDYTEEYGFTNYARRMIDRTILCTLADQMGVSPPMMKYVHKLPCITEQYLLELDREPIPEEIAKEMDLTEKKMRNLLMAIQVPVSLETPTGEDDTCLGEVLLDDRIPLPEDAGMYAFSQDHLDYVLDTLTEREQKVIRLRYGMVDGCTYTQDEIGKLLGYSSYRIRWVEKRALRKLRHPTRSNKLKGYLT